MLSKIIDFSFLDFKRVSITSFGACTFRCVGICLVNVMYYHTIILDSHLFICAYNI